MENPPRLLLNKFYSIEEFLKLPQTLKILQWGRVFDLYLPTARVSTKPEIFVPKVARAYSTSHFWSGSKIVTYDELHALRRAETGTFNGTSYEDAIYLFEYWEDNGSDGHVEYTHRGYIFSTILFPDSIYPESELNDLYLRHCAEE